LGKIIIFFNDDLLNSCISIVIILYVHFYRRGSIIIAMGVLLQNKTVWGTSPTGITVHREYGLIKFLLLTSRRCLLTVLETQHVYGKKNYSSENKNSQSNKHI
jgi:hypothetical protein